jgi:peptide/nickel transport system substrate-binding protein
MKRMQRLCTMTVLLILLAACGAPAAPDGPVAGTAEPTSAAGIVAERGTLRLGHEVVWGGFDSIDPASPSPFYDAMRMLYDTLVRPDASNQPQPALASSWETSDDASIWTFTLRDDVVFHNGQPLRAADVAYSFERLLSPDSLSPISSVLQVIESISTPDAQTVVFNLNQPHAEVPVLFMSFYASIIPADSGATVAETGIGSDPFKLESLDPEDTTRLVANDDYWQGSPGLAAIEMVGIPDADARLQALQAGQIDVVFEPTAQQVNVLETNTALTIQRVPGGPWYSISMRTDTPPFDDARVRKAMRLATDRQQMIDLVLQGEGVIACDTLVGPEDQSRWDGSCPQDIEQARALLAEAGYADGLDVTLYTSNSFAPMVPMAEVYQQ